MRFTIAPQIFERFPGLYIGVIVCKDIDNTHFQEEISRASREQEDRIRAEFTAETLSQNPHIDVWRNAYRTFGAKPKENRSSVENLYRMVLQGVNLRHINTLVDIYNFISLKHMVPVGGEDLEKIQGDIILGFAGASEAPVLLLGDREPRPPHAGEVIYKDNLSAICRRWNWREADRTKLTEVTKNCFLVIEGLPPAGEREIESATQELKEMVQKFCGGDLALYILDEDKPGIEF